MNLDHNAALRYPPLKAGPSHVFPLRPTGGEAEQEAAVMFQNFDEIQKLSKENVDVAVKTVSAVTKGVQAIAVEVADYSKKSFEQSSATVEKLFGAKSLDKAIEIQSEYVKATYEGLISQATKLGSLYTDMAKEAYKPYESVFTRFGSKA
jgi:hypothetical protein